MTVLRMVVKAFCACGDSRHGTGVIQRPLARLAQITRSAHDQNAVAKLGARQLQQIIPNRRTNIIYLTAPVRDPKVISL